MDRMASRQSPAPTVSFEGIADNMQFIPPDTHGAVGPRHLMVAVNGNVRVQNRDGSVVSTVTLNQFWASVGPFQSFSFDPKVFYDASSQRWILVSCVDAESAANAILIGVSQTDDPTRNWNLYKIDSDAQDEIWADYPSVGYNGKWIVVSFNMFYNDPSRGYKGSHIWVFDKANLNSGGAGNFTLLQDNSGFTQCPTVMFDDTQQTMFLVETYTGRSLRISTITGAIGQEGLNIGSGTTTSLQGWSFAGGNIAPQKDSNALIQNNDARIQNVVLRNGSLWCAHTVFYPEGGNPTRSAVQWWQLGLNGQIQQQGRIEDRNGAKFFAFPSIAVNRNNDVLIGYSRFGRDQYPSANYSFRYGTDPANAMQPDIVFKDGEGPYMKDFGSGRNRWGDYSATVVDPLDDINMWTIQEYAMAPSSVSRWGTWWAMINLLEPPDGVLEFSILPPPLTPVVAGQSTNILVRLTDVLAVTNATVTAVVDGATTLNFRNDGVAPDQVRSNEVYSASLFIPTGARQVSLDFTISAPGKDTLFTNVVYEAFPLPTNDNFVNAIKIPSEGAFGSRIIEATNHFATVEQGEPNHAGLTNTLASLWWNWSSPVNTRVLIDTAGSGIDSVVAVYTGNAISALNPVAFGDDHDLGNLGVRKQAFVVFNALAGVTYRIVVATKDVTGPIRLRLEPNGSLDITPPRINISSPPSGIVVESSTIEIRGTSFDPEPNSSGIRRVVLDNFNIRPRSILPPEGTTNWSVIVDLEIGTNIFRAYAVDFSNNRSPEEEVIIYYRRTEVPNDLFAQATVLSANSGSVTGTNLVATKEFQEPAHAGNEGGRSIWYKFTPTASGLLLLSTEGSTTTSGGPLDTLLALYTGSFVNQLTLVQSNDDAPGGAGHSEITASLTGGVTYYIAVDTYAGVAGTVNLSHTFQPATVFRVTAQAEDPSQGSVTPSEGFFPNNSTVTLTAIPAPYFEFDRFIRPDGTLLSDRNPYSFLVTGNADVRVRFRTRTFDEDFEAGISKLPWENAGWTVVDELRSGVPGTKVAASTPHDPRGINSLVLVTNLVAGNGSFEFRVSTERDYDKLEFYINGELRESWSGEIPWTLYTFNIPAPGGSTRLEWRYVKDNAVNRGEDRVFLDNIELPIGNPPPPVQPQLTISENREIRVTASPNRAYAVEASSDLQTWTVVAERSTNASGEFTFTEPLIPGVTARFYRVVSR